MHDEEKQNLKLLSFDRFPKDVRLLTSLVNEFLHCSSYSSKCYLFEELFHVGGLLNLVVCFVNLQAFLHAGMFLLLDYTFRFILSFRIDSIFPIQNVFSIK